LVVMDIANPSEEHAMLRSMIRDWVEEYVEPQAFEHDKKELFNLGLLRSMGELGLLGISAPEDYGGAGLDATACAIIHEELFEEELLSLKKKLTLGQIISMYSVLREELSVIEYDLTTGSLGIEDDA